MNKIKLSKDCYWDSENEKILENDSLVLLSSSMLACLRLLILNRDRPVSSENIFHYIWGEEDKKFKSKAIRSLISSLRKKLPSITISNHYGGFYSLEKYRDALPDFKDYLLDILDQSKNGITITDPNQKDNPLIYVNEAFTDMFGYSAEEIIGLNCRFLHADDTNQTAIENIRKAIENKKDITVVIRNYHKSGSLIYNEVTVSPIFDKKSLKLKYFLGVQKDVSVMYKLLESRGLLYDE